MAKDNTLGAPTEGLGQTVTFAVGGSQGTPQMAAEQRQALRNQQQGGFAIQPKQAQFIPDRAGDSTFQLLARLGGELLKPHIEQERTAAYVDGMRRAAQGEAITELVDEQPAFSKIFGSTSLVDGARAYTASAKARTIVTDLETNMPKLRQMSEQEFSKHVADKMLGSSTGDSTTDMIVQQQLSQVLPSAMKTWTKENLKFKTEQLETSMTADLAAAFAGLGAADAQVRNPDSTREPIDVLEQATSVIKATVRPADMDKNHHDMLVAKSAAKAIRGGNFAVFSMVEGSKRLDAMSDEAQAHIRQSLFRARQEARLKLPLEFAEKLSEWDVLSETGTREDIIKGAAGLNDFYTKLTGDNDQYLGPPEVARNLSQRTAYERRMIEKLQHDAKVANTKVTKDEAELAARTKIGELIKTGGYLNGIPKDDREFAFQLVKSSTTPEDFNGLLVKQYGLGTKYEAMASITQGRISAALTSGSPDTLAQVYKDTYLPLVKASGDRKTAVADIYAGDHAELMQRYHKLAEGNPNLGAIDANVFYAEATRPRPKEMPEKKTAAVVKALTNWSSLPNWRLFGRGDTVDYVDPKGLARELDDIIDHRLPPDVGVEQALRKAENSNLTVAGGHFWRRSTKDTAVVGWLHGRNNIGSDEVNRAMRLSIDKAATDAGIDGLPTVQQVPDANGVPRMYVIGLGSDGSTKIELFSGTYIESNWNAKKKADEWKRSDLQFGPELTNLISDDMPSPYASAEEWKAYRKRQKQKK